MLPCLYARGEVPGPVPASPVRYAGMAAIPARVQYEHRWASNYMRGPATTHGTTLGIPRGVGPSPGYLHRVDIVCIAAGCGVWSAPLIPSWWGMAAHTGFAGPQDILTEFIRQVANGAWPTLQLEASSSRPARVQEAQWRGPCESFSCCVVL